MAAVRKRTEAAARKAKKRKVVNPPLITAEQRTPFFPANISEHADGERRPEGCPTEASHRRDLSNATPRICPSPLAFAVGMLRGKKKIRTPADNVRTVASERAVCDVCGQDDSTPSDLLLSCTHCAVRAHQSCCGVDEVPADGWTCEPCVAQGDSRRVVCSLCLRYGGVLKPSAVAGQDQWAHVACALWVPETGFCNAATSMDSVFGTAITI